ncbi:hypothetical protein NHX12_008953 [Muraenolepis orangiensis]|uniref:Sodium channel regulatory subunit beta-3 n=1 Tax=Muraenolepis orangiensis TaxID=630683 RepID=A0A9Q0DMG0_9TELE|nr:hypothetical protein NHX12_008953 [Muraenolepis orangiensis]
MIGPVGARLLPLLLLIFVVRPGLPVCVDIPTDGSAGPGPPIVTEAVLGRGAKLICISCLTREEVKTVTSVVWNYLTDNNTLAVPIFRYKDRHAIDVAGPWEKRLIWNGSFDLQDVSIRIVNVTLNDSGTYHCNVSRQFEFGSVYYPMLNRSRVVRLNVNPTDKADPTTVYSEVMMYVLLVCLTLWLLVEMVYCYRKISRADEHTQDPA